MVDHANVQVTTEACGIWPALSREDRFDRVLDVSPRPTLMIGDGDRIELANPDACRLFGYHRSELIGQPVETLFVERPPAGNAALRDALRDRATMRATPASLDAWAQHKSGRDMLLEVSFNPITLDGAPVLLAGFADVTPRWRMQQQQERHRRDLERSNADLQEFAYAASHDLKAPLRAIGYLAEWISNDLAAASPAIRENLTLLRERVRRLQKLLDGLLAYALIGNGGQDTVSVDIAAVVDDVVSLLAPPAGFVVRYEGPLTCLLTQLSPIEAVLENLIGNGIKHHDRLQGRITVQARRCEEDRDMVEFRVSDDGPGVAPSDHERIFQLFHTLSGHDDGEGSGIGLAIVKRRVLLHGGQVHVESAPPMRGTTIVFTWREGAPS